jgi:hypothetical protein
MSETTLQKLKILNDLQIVNTVSALGQDPAALSTFLQKQQDKVYKKVKRQKEDTFSKVYGDLSLSTDVQKNYILHNKRNRDLYAVQENVIKNQENSANTIIQDKQLAGRKNEMNEWSVGNKKDTLFIYSSLFITLSLLILITALWRLGMISGYLMTAIAAAAILIFILILLNRAYYTDVSRNKRLWNKRIFEGKYEKIPVPMCATAGQDIANASQNAMTAAQQGATNLQNRTSRMFTQMGQALGAPAIVPPPQAIPP